MPRVATEGVNTRAARLHVVAGYAMPDRRTVAIVAVGAATAAVATAIVLHRRRSSAKPVVAAAADSNVAASVDAKGQSPVDASATGADPPPLSSAEEARRAKERGNKRFQGRQYESAIAEYSKAIGLADPNDPEVAKYYGNRAQCHACLEQHAEAEADCDAALRCDPSYVKAIARRATAREKLGKDEAAMVDFTGALLLSGMNHPSASDSVDRLVKKIAAAKAEVQLKKPMRCLPSPSFISTFVDSFCGHRQLLEAAPRCSAEEVSAGLESAEGHTRGGLLVERALARMRTRQYEGAMQDWGAAVCLVSPLGDDFAEGTASAPPSDQERASTLEAWSNESALTQPSLAFTMLGMFLHLRGNYDSAMACYDRALDLTPSAINVLLKRSSLWFEKEQLPKAFADFDTALALDAEHADTYCHRGQLHMLQQDLAKAIADLKKSVQLDGGSILARIQLGMAHHRLKQVAEARAVFQQAEKDFPTSPDALNYHGEFLVESGDLSGAASKFNKALEVSGSSYALAHVNLGVLKLHAEQDLNGAIERCKQAVSVDPLCETAHVHMAHLHLQNSDLSAAVAAFDDALSLLRVKQELEEAFTMREAAGAQLALLAENPTLYQPAIDNQRAQAQAIAAQMARQ